MRESVIYQDILAEGEARGEAQGIVKGKQRVARNLLATGMSPEQVAAIAELSLGEVRELQKQDK